MRKIVYLTIISSMVGAGTISVSVGGFQLSLFRSLVILLALVSLADILINNKKIRIKIKEHNNYSIKYMFIWLAYAFFSLAWVKDYIGWLKAIFFIGIGLLSVLIFKKYFRNKVDILNSMRVIFPIILLHNLLGWYEILTGNYLFLADQRIARYVRFSHPVSTFGNTNDYAVFLVFAVFILYICFMNSNKMLIKTLYIITIVSSTVLVFFTSSRAALLGLILGALILVFYSVQRKQTRKVILLLLTFLFITVIINSSIIYDLLFNLENVLDFDFTEQKGSEFVRINLIKNGFQFLSTTFGFGTGAGNIEYWMENYASYYIAGVYNIHNWWMEILVGYGVIIFLLYLAFYVKLIMSMKMKFKIAKNRTDITISLGILCILIGYVIASVSSSSNMTAEWLWVFWAIVITYQGIPVDNKYRK